MMAIEIAVARHMTVNRKVRGQLSIAAKRTSGPQGEASRVYGALSAP